MPTNSEIVPTIVQMVAEREGVDPTDMPPMYDTLDPDALDSILAGKSSEPLLIHFTYAGYQVWIESEDETTVSIEPKVTSPMSNNGCGSLP